MHIGLVIAFAVMGGAALTLISLKLMQILQLSSYRLSGITAWAKRTKFDYAVRYFALSFFCFISMFLFVLCFSKAEWYSSIGFIFFVALCAYFAFAVRKQEQKTPLKFTKRVIRLIVVDFIVNGALVFGLVWLSKDTAVMYSPVGALPLFVGFSLALAHVILLPIEKLIGKIYLSKAVKKLNKAKPTVIGITGSYGKTTAKKVLATFLHTKYKVFASPNSYNTPMGLSKCINEEYRGEEIFVAEMGARRKGDIKFLKKIFKPQYAMLTAIGNQHLETFGCKENIIKEKVSILDGVKYAVANGDVSEVAANVNGKAELCGKSGEASYCNVISDINGTQFTLTVGESKVDIKTRLVGDHIPVIITMCALMAVKLGVELKKIKEAAEKLPFVDHRLEVMHSGDFVIFDDSYNSNPVGADNALRLLSSYQGTKVIITPGFVELGADLDKSLVEFGEKIAKVCDYAILLGPNAQKIKSGMGEFENVTIVGSLREAMAELKGIAPPVAVLFENDLPDNY